MLKVSVFALLICLNISLCFAQDSVKKTSPAKPAATPAKASATGVKPPTTFIKPAPHVYKYHSKADSIAARQTSVAKPDSGAAPVVVDKSLNGQYQYLLGKVYHYQQPLISALWKSASDTLEASNHKLKAAQDKVTSQAKLIDSLNTASAAAQNQENSSANLGSNISVFGLFYMPKSTYNLMMWGLVAVFGITALVIITQSGRHRSEAKYRIKLFNELEEEYKAYKTKANDKEKKLARELQTERNKLDDLLGK